MGHHKQGLTIGGLDIPEKMALIHLEQTLDFIYRRGQNCINIQGFSNLIGQPEQ